MRRWRKYLLLLVVGLAAVALVIAFVPPREPSYNGKHLSHWVVNLAANDSFDSRPKQVEAEDSIRHIGTNALPYLLQWIQYQPPVWKTELRQKARALPYILRRIWEADRADLRAYGAVLAFKFLGAQAEEAVPALVTVLTNSAKEQGPARAASALGFLGKEALPPLLAILTNQQHRLRVDAALSIGKMGTNALPAVSALIQCLSDTNLSIAIWVPGILGRLKLEPDLVIPALGNALKDSRADIRGRAGYALGEYGDKARSAVPALLELLNDPVRSVRFGATNALRKIDPQALDNVGHQ